MLYCLLSTPACRNRALRSGDVCCQEQLRVLSGARQCQTLQQEQGNLPAQHTTSMLARVIIVSGHQQLLISPTCTMTVQMDLQLLMAQLVVQAGAGDLVAQRRGAGGEEGWLSGCLRAGVHQTEGPQSSPERLHDAALHRRHTAVQPCRVSPCDAWWRVQHSELRIEGWDSDGTAAWTGQQSAPG